MASLVSLAQSGQIASGYANTTLTKAISLQPGYFVIWDGVSYANGTYLWGSFGNDTYGDGTLYSVQSQTKDVDLQRAQMQKTALLERAAQLSSGLQMDFKSAIQLTQLADRIQTLQSTQNQLTDADRSAISQTLLGIAGVSQDELNQAIASGLKGDMTAPNALIDKISQNLGMPTATLRDQVLPKLGVTLN